MGVVSMTSICGMQSLKFENIPKRLSISCRKREGSPLNLIDQIIEDPYFEQQAGKLAAKAVFMKQAAMPRS